MRALFLYPIGFPFGGAGPFGGCDAFQGRGQGGFLAE